MNEIEVLRSDALHGAQAASSVLMRITPLPDREVTDVVKPSSAMFGALKSLGLGFPELQTALRDAARVGGGLTVAFPPEVVTALKDGTLRLMQAADGMLPTAVNASGRIASNARVVGGAAAGGVAGGALVGASAATIAMVALPIVIAGAAAYAQQRQLNKALDQITEIVQRIEARLEDTDSGACDAAERFLSLCQDALIEGGFTEYLQLELAAQRTAIEGLYGARQQWVDRFKTRLEADQIAREQHDGPGQPWVKYVAEQARNGKLEQELTLFVRTLLSRTRLGALTATVLAEEGRGTTAMKLMHDLEVELRSQFFDLHNRLSPLARIAPEISLREKLPITANSTQQAHETIKELVAHLNEQILPSIPDPYNQREVRAALGPATVHALALDIERDMIAVPLPT